MFCVKKKKNLNFTAFDWLTDSIHQTLVKSVRSYLNHSIDDMTCVHCATISAWLFTQQISVLYYFFYFFFFYLWPRDDLSKTLQSFFFFFFPSRPRIAREAP